ncbi:hypothetical protein [Streptomyces sp. NPDC091217]|uniref:hypothetical protein n=1 Tax=Streptomyces sp. NPDC091217 TaxID=3365975 RepID=UPI003802816D
MTSTYRSDHAADPVLFERLMRERYGPLAKVMAERTRLSPPPVPPRGTPAMRPAYQSGPDPDAAKHLADLGEAIGVTVHRPAPAAAEQRIPPAPGMVWCNSCDGWCTPQGICGCNDT